MRNHFIGAMLTAALMSAAWGQAPPPAAKQASKQSPAKQAKGPATAVRPATIAGHPNLNGIWQALNTANWNLEAHSARSFDDFWGLGAIAAEPAGKSVITGDGKIPYLPKALEQRNKNRDT